MLTVALKYKENWKKNSIWDEKRAIILRKDETAV